MKSFREFIAESLNRPKVGQLITISGKKIPTDTHDGDDTFPPAIARYEIIDNYVVAHGHNGSIQIITAPTQKALTDWMNAVDQQGDIQEKSVKWSHQQTTRINNHLNNLKKRFKVNYQIEYATTTNRQYNGETSGGTITLFNPHTEKKEAPFTFTKKQFSTLIKTATHEYCHVIFSKKPSQYMALKNAKPPTLYATLSPGLELIIECMTAYILTPKEYQQFDNDAYAALERLMEPQK